MKYRHYDWDAPFQDAYICIVLDAISVEPQNLKQISQRLNILRKRFSLKILLVATSPTQIGTHVIRDLLIQDCAQQFIFSGQARYLLADTLAAAKRISTEHLLFASGTALISAFPEVLKFLVENSYVFEPAYASATGQLICMNSQNVQTCDLGSELPVRWNQFVTLLTPHTVQSRKFFESDETLAPSNTLRDDDNNCYFFATKQGMERLGGFAKVQSLPITVGGIAIKAYNKILLIDNELSSNTDVLEENGKIRIINGCTQTESGDQIIYDINPAPWFRNALHSSSEKKEINLPRQILYARVIEETNIGKEENRPTAVFVMSNYNKADYIKASLYSIICQTHQKVIVEIIDDCSTDNSLDQISEFKQLLNLDDSIVRVRSNLRNRGTYWIRNRIISEHRDTDNIYLVNDSDDYSAAQRSFIQTLVISASSASKGCFGDIVRVDNGYSLLPLNNQVERYGTASLGCQAKFHSEIGYFQNFRKNADTEFIERVKKFAGKTAVSWFRYPVLFQTFDGKNLTADIYEIGTAKRVLSQSLGNRASHTDAIRKHHARITKKDMLSHFNFPMASIPNEYLRIGTDYFMDGYRGFDACMLIANTAETENICSTVAAKGFHVVQQRSDGVWKISGPGGKNYFSDLPFLEALLQYMQKMSFYGYILPLVWLKKASRIEAPKDFLQSVLFDQVLQSKSESDRVVYEINEQGSLRAIDGVSVATHFWNFQGTELARLFLHSEALLRKNSSAVVPRTSHTN